MSPARRRSPQVNIADALGASDQTSVQVLTLYIPSRDRDGRAIKDHDRWVKTAADLLVQVGGGVTIAPPVRGGWQNPKGKIIWEDTVLLYSYVKPDLFLASLRSLRNFAHRLGRETKQGEVVVEFDRTMYRITNFDPE